MSSVITVDHLSKKYIISHQRQERYTALRDVLATRAKHFANKMLHPFSAPTEDPTREEFWALKDVSFEIQQGDRVGIIGRNGAGKSTLLKVLSRITEPTSGKVQIKGRVASLLEVGTGFHPELTGRENIYLNGAILGMSKVEIRQKFDEIVAFAEVEKFLDTPVKRYSSGMYVRLAFAVAAHLEPEILIVDEVLAVGDAQFQKKCLGKMDEVGKQGRTVLFVSHNMGVISQLCPSCIWLENGRVREVGITERIVSVYMQNGIAAYAGDVEFDEDDAKPAQLKRLTLLNEEGQICQNFDCDQSVQIRIEIKVKKPLPGLYGYLGIDKTDGTKILVSDSFDGSSQNPLDNLSQGNYQFKIVIPARTLAAGEYLIIFSLACPAADQFQVDTPGTVCSFTLDDFTSRRGNLRAGYFSTLLAWQAC